MDEQNPLAPVPAGADAGTQGAQTVPIAAEPMPQPSAPAPSSTVPVLPETPKKKSKLFAVGGIMLVAVILISSILILGKGGFFKGAAVLHPTNLVWNDYNGQCTVIGNGLGFGTEINGEFLSSPIRCIYPPSDSVNGIAYRWTLNAYIPSDNYTCRYRGGDYSGGNCTFPDGSIYRWENDNFVLVSGPTPPDFSSFTDATACRSANGLWYNDACYEPANIPSGSQCGSFGGIWTAANQCQAASTGCTGTYNPADNSCQVGQVISVFGQNTTTTNYEFLAHPERSCTSGRAGTYNASARQCTLSDGSILVWDDATNDFITLPPPDAENMCVTENSGTYITGPPQQCNINGVIYDWSGTDYYLDQENTACRTLGGTLGEDNVCTVGSDAATRAYLCAESTCTPNAEATCLARSWGYRANDSAHPCFRDTDEGKGYFVWETDHYSFDPVFTCSDWDGEFQSGTPNRCIMTTSVLNETDQGYVDIGFIQDVIGRICTGINGNFQSDGTPQQYFCGTGTTTGYAGNRTIYLCTLDGCNTINIARTCQGRSGTFSLVNNECHFGTEGEIRTRWNATTSIFDVIEEEDDDSQAQIKEQACQALQGTLQTQNTECHAGASEATVVHAWTGERFQPNAVRTCAMRNWAPEDDSGMICIDGDQSYSWNGSNFIITETIVTAQSQCNAFATTAGASSEARNFNTTTNKCRYELPSDRTIVADCTETSCILNVQESCEASFPGNDQGWSNGQCIDTAENPLDTKVYVFTASGAVVDQAATAALLEQGCESQTGMTWRNNACLTANETALLNELQTLNNELSALRIQVGATQSQGQSTAALQQEIARLTALFNERLAAAPQQIVVQVQQPAATTPAATTPAATTPATGGGAPSASPPIICPDGFIFDTTRRACTPANEVVAQASSRSAQVTPTPREVEEEAIAGAATQASSGSVAAAGVSSVTETAAASGETAPTGGASAGAAATTGISAGVAAAGSQTIAQAAGTSAAGASVQTQAAGTVTQLHGAYIQGKTGPGLLAYPALLAAANALLYFRRKRIKK